MKLRSKINKTVSNKSTSKTLIDSSEEAELILNDLQKNGFSISTINELIEKPIDYKEALPILLGWINEIDSPEISETIIRAVSVPWAKNVAVEPLIKRLKREKGSENKSLAWAIGNALYVVATKSNADELLEIINDNTYKNARQMIILKIGIMKIRQSEDILIQLLSEEGVRGHAIAALGYLGSLKSKPYIQKYIDHSNKWIQTESKKAIKRINKVNKIDE